MKPLKIFCDVKLSSDQLEFLKQSVSPHEILLPENPAASVLSPGVFDPKFKQADIAFGQPGLESILSSENLKWIQLTSASFTRYDTEEFRKTASEKNLKITNSSTVYAEPCAEHVFAFMLADSIRLPFSLKTRITSSSQNWADLRKSNRLLRNQTVLILGFGAIALHLIDLLKPFSMNIIGRRRNPKGKETVPIITKKDLPQTLGKADHVINILPDNEESTQFFDEKMFSYFKQDSVFYNIGRGTTVNQEALYRVLKSGKLRGAWLDVTDPEPLPPGHPLFDLENCYITPHTAGGFSEEKESLIRHFLKNLERYVQEKDLLDRVL